MRRSCLGNMPLTDFERRQCELAIRRNQGHHGVFGSGQIQGKSLYAIHAVIFGLSCASVGNFKEKNQRWAYFPRYAKLLVLRPSGKEVGGACAPIPAVTAWVRKRTLSIYGFSAGRSGFCASLIDCRRCRIAAVPEGFSANTILPFSVRLSSLNSPSQ